jgi:hypothetical protein
MKTSPHAVVWIDHAQARVIRFDAETSTTSLVRPDGGTPHLHHKANSIDSGHLAENQAYLHAVGQALANVGSVLVVGPATAKNELLNHIARHDPQMLEKI